MIKALSLWCIIPAAIVVAGECPVSAADPPGSIIVARPAGDALILWDASALVTQIVADKTPRDAALQILESQAIGIMGSRLQLLAKAKTVSVRVIYLRSGAVNPAYNAATLEGVEKVLTIKAPAAKVRASSPSWAKQLKDGKIPGDLAVNVTGELPSP